MKHSTTIRGMTLLEVTVASSILSLVLIITLTFLQRISDLTQIEQTEIFMERQLQFSLDSIVADMKESNPGKVSFKDFKDEEGNWQTAICFPTAREMVNSSFVYLDATGKVFTEPQWQGVIVYATATDPVDDQSFLVKYTDYTARDYLTQMPEISQVTDDNIILGDGTTFKRDQASGLVGNQRTQRLAASVTQLVRNPAPPANALYPLNLSLTAKKVMAELRGQDLVVESTTSVLARNNN